MKVNSYVVIGLGVYIIFVTISGIYQNLLSGLPYFLKIINLILMLAYLCLGIFLIRLKNWARITAVICALIYLVLVLSALFIMHQKHSLFDTNFIPRTFDVEFIIHFLINIFTIYYLTRPKVREQFK